MLSTKLILSSYSASFFLGELGQRNLNLIENTHCVHTRIDATLLAGEKKGDYNSNWSKPCLGSVAELPSPTVTATEIAQGTASASLEVTWALCNTENPSPRMLFSSELRSSSASGDSTVQHSCSRPGWGRAQQNYLKKKKVLFWDPALRVMPSFLPCVTSSPQLLLSCAASST